VKKDDSSLEPHEHLVVTEAAKNLLNKADAWGRFPTPINDLMAAAQLKVAPVSVFDERTMWRYLQEAGEKAKQLLRQAMDKILGIFDVHANVIHIDPTVSPEKQTFLQLHEIGHKEIPHQNGIYRWIQDGDQHLASEVAELFEREANTFASIVLFQNDAFANMASDYEFGIKVPLKISRNFGASLYAGIREYVRSNPKVCAVIILNPTSICPTNGATAGVRRIEMSQGFRDQFSPFLLPAELTPNDGLMRFIPINPKVMSRPDTFIFFDRNGQRHEFVGEGFRTPYNTFILIHAKITLKPTILISQRL